MTVFPEAAAWAILFLPLASFAFIALVLRPFFNHRPQWSGYVTILAIGGSFLLSLWALSSVAQVHEHVIVYPNHPWLQIGNLQVELGIMMDSLTAIMLVVVSLVSLCIQIYSQGYMHGDPGYPRYYASMSLFTASMLGLVLASNLLQLYVFWELVGLCSYLLIGFWFQRPAAAAAAKKAFIVTRFGDFGFLLAILFIFREKGTFDIGELHAMALAGSLSGAALTWLALGVFAGATGKSAQFPLHTWLPDAMEGPTPVSALIHAATMVAAGVFLVARFFPVFSHSVEAMSTVALIGGVTAVFAASMGLVMNDIKRVLAYSTVSQLGYMMLGLGVGGYVAGMFHLFNHAFFKALLFLGAGSVNHATNTFDMKLMGGLRKAMPWTFATFLVAALSLAGIAPLSGFWSKDEIILHAWQENKVLFALAAVGAFMTAFYIFRAVFLTFAGEYRGGAAAEPGGHGGHGEPKAHLHESPLVMVGPMVVLGLLAIVSGAVNLPVSFLGIPAHWMSDFMETPTIAKVTHGEVGGFDASLAGLSLGLSLLGILLAYAIYGARWLSPERIGRAFGPLYTLVSRKYFFDELYEDLIVRKLLYRTASGLLDLFDRRVVDGVVDGVAWLGRNTGGLVGKLQTGQLQVYGLAIPLGILAILVAFMLWGG